MTQPGTPVKVRDDQPAPIVVQYRDAEGAITTQLPEGATLAFTTDNPALATVRVNADQSGAVLIVTAGWNNQPTHVVNVSATSPFQSEPVAVEIDPTVATSEAITITASA